MQDSQLAAQVVGEACDQTPTGVATEDSFLHYVIPEDLTPDPSLWGKQAKLAFHRVFPLYANGKCEDVPTHVLVLSHGRTVTGPAAFDLKDPTGGDDTSFSLQRTLARRGIESYALEHLGYGHSSRFFLNDPCNASKPGDALGGQSWSNAHMADQQALLIPPDNGPLAERCEHTSNVRFARPAMAVFDLVQMINHALEVSRPTSGRVTVLGYSAGGARVGAFLDPGNFERGNDPDANLLKIDRAILIAPIYDRPGPTEEVGSPPTPYPTFPLAVRTEASIPNDWRMPTSREAVCTGHRVPGTPEQEWLQMMERETAGRDWGVPDDDKTTGLSRFPTFSRHRFNQVVVGRYRIPFLLIQGLDDTIFGASGSCNLYNDVYKNALSPPPKVALFIGCASQMLLVEGCDPSRCTSGWAGPRASVQDAIAEWIKSGTVGGFASGRLLVNQNTGAITPIAEGAMCPPSP